MQCPVCENALTELHIDLETSEKWDQMRVDACVGGCGGIWFDRFELDKVDETDETAGRQLLEIDHDSSIRIDHDADRNCPNCRDVVMMKRFFSVSRRVELDECGGCAGIWLDAGELEDVRQHFETEQERQEAFDKFYREEMAPKLAELRTGEKTDDGIRSVLKFVSPTNWFS